MKKFLYFDEMLTPKIIQIVFWLTSVIFIVAGLVIMARSYDVGFLIGLAMVVLGPFLIRVWCELMIVIFKIHESLQFIKKRLT
ncbi:MAG: DUF4282 domain-containing protein [Syntrophomonadaceae bacterium]|nr:DUF4282 domain-containing protein [Syntrophomonadaceae bacterium]